MAVIKKELREILDRYSIDPTDQSKLWNCHGTLVLYHRAYEIIAAREGITFDPPVMIETNSAGRIVAMLVVGRWKERVEWSVGEAAPDNSKNAYPYAIAEKRGKDRVVAKLVGLAEHVYSEDEADEFKTGGMTQAEVADNRPLAAAPAEKARDATSMAKSPTPSSINEDADNRREVMPHPRAEPALPAQGQHNAQPPSSEAGAGDSDKRIAEAAYKRLRLAIRAATLPNVIDTIIGAGKDDLAFIKRVNTPAYDQIMALATAQANELRAGA